jgi:hypothetical protein
MAPKSAQSFHPSVLDYNVDTHSIRETSPLAPPSTRFVFDARVGAVLLLDELELVIGRRGDDDSAAKGFG